MRRLLVPLILFATGCTVGGSPGSAEPAPSRALAQPPAGRASSKALTSDDLFSVYQAVLTSAVQQVEPVEVLQGALRGARAAGVEQGLLPVDVAILDTVRVTPEAGPRDLWAPFRDAYDGFVEKLGTRADITRVGKGAAQGMVAVLADPLATVHDSSALDAQRTRDAGIGVTLTPSSDGGEPIVRAVDPNGPAARAGIKAGDVIRAVGGRETRGMDLYDVLAAFSGASGSRVVLAVSSGGVGTAAEISITRGRVRMVPLKTDLAESVQVIDIRAFEPGVTDAVRHALIESASAGAIGWVIDLRGNGEGSLTEAAGVASLFVGRQTIGQDQDRDGRTRPVRGTTQALDTLLPLVVLVDGATAGPGELVAAAIHDYGLGTIVGMPTAGRLGTPRLISLSDGSAAQITVRRMLSPSGSSLLGTGVSPEELVATDPQLLAAGTDAALDRAFQLLR